MKAEVRRSSPARQWKLDRLSPHRRLMQDRRLHLDNNLLQGNSRRASHLNSDHLGRRRRWNHRLSLADHRVKARQKSIKVWDVSA